VPSVLFFEQPQPKAQLGCWDGFAGNFRLAIGYSAWGDFVLRNPDTGQIAILYVIEPELVPISFWDLDLFVSQYLAAPEVQSHLIRPERLAAVERRLGPLALGEVFTPELPLFLGGTCEPDTYEKSDVWTFVDFMGQLQGVDTEA